MQARELEQRLAALAQGRGAPAASLAVLRGDELVSVATGVLSVETQVAATPDTVFEVGSITKPYTATAVMRLVEAGGLELDARVRDVLPGFRVADPVTTERVTVRQLLTHTSGIAGDRFDDTGRGDDALERYVELAAGFGQDAPCGVTMSYCNSGYSILGRVIERVTGQVWDDALRALVLEPLGLRHTHTLVEDLLGLRIAIGHEAGDDGVLRHARRTDGRSVGPAGGIWSTAEELARFAQLFLRGGVAPGGARLLAADTVASMLAPQVAIPDPYVLAATHWGLGWILHGWEGRTVYGHAGNGHGHSSALVVVPDRGVAVAVLTNGGNGSPLIDDVLRAIVPEVADVAVPRWPEPARLPAPPQVERWLGRYECCGLRFELERRGRQLAGTVVSSEPDGEERSSFPVRPTTAGGDVYVAQVPGHGGRWVPLVLYEAGGERYLHFGARAHRKVA